MLVAHVAMAKRCNMQVRYAKLFTKWSSGRLRVLTSNLLDSNCAIDTASRRIGDMVVRWTEVYLGRFLERTKETALAAL